MDEKIVGNNSFAQESRNGDGRVRRPYHAPELTSLGEIQSIIQSGGDMGVDMHGTTCSTS